MACVFPASRVGHRSPADGELGVPGGGSPHEARGSVSPGDAIRPSPLRLRGAAIVAAVAVLLPAGVLRPATAAGTKAHAAADPPPFPTGPRAPFPSRRAPRRRRRLPQGDPPDHHPARKAGWTKVRWGQLKDGGSVDMTFAAPSPTCAGSGCPSSGTWPGRADLDYGWTGVSLDPGPRLPPLRRGPFHRVGDDGPGDARNVSAAYCDGGGYATGIATRPTPSRASTGGSRWARSRAASSIAPRALVEATPSSTGPRPGAQRRAPRRAPRSPGPALRPRPVAAASRPWPWTWARPRRPIAGSPTRRATRWPAPPSPSSRIPGACLQGPVHQPLERRRAAAPDRGHRHHRRERSLHPRQVVSGGVLVVARRGGRVLGSWSPCSPRAGPRGWTSPWRDEAAQWRVTDAKGAPLAGVPVFVGSTSSTCRRRRPAPTGASRSPSPTSAPLARLGPGPQSPRPAWSSTAVATTTSPGSRPQCQRGGPGGRAPVAGAEAHVFPPYYGISTHTDAKGRFTLGGFSNTGSPGFALRASHGAAVGGVPFPSPRTPGPW